MPLTPPPPARGLDVRACNTVINFEPANDLDSFIHRIGRTGRAGGRGVGGRDIRKHKVVFTVQGPRKVSRIRS